VSSAVVSVEDPPPHAARSTTVSKTMSFFITPP
jgi:hypothetical protein